MKTPQHSYTAEQLDYLRRHATTPRRRLTVKFNIHFGLQLTEEQIKGTCFRIGLRTGRSGCYKKGNTPYNAGTKGLKKGSCTSYKPGQMPHNWQPVGTEVFMKKDGYWKVKIAEPKTWKHKHVHIWEQHHGPVPDGYCIVFADRDTNNFDHDNLVCVRRNELLYLNRHALIKEDADLTKTAVNIAKVAIKTNALRRGTARRERVDNQMSKKEQ